MVEAISLDIHDLYRLQVQERCRISALYSALLMSQNEFDMKMSCVGHDWSLRNIQTLCDDLMTRIPKGQMAGNMYSQRFNSESKDALAALTELHTALKRHNNICSRIELVTKGV